MQNAVEAGIGLALEPPQNLNCGRGNGSNYNRCLISGLRQGPGEHAIILTLSLVYSRAKLRETAQKAGTLWENSAHFTGSLCWPLLCFCLAAKRSLKSCAAWVKGSAVSKRGCTAEGQVPRHHLLLRRLRLRPPRKRSSSSAAGQLRIRKKGRSL